MSLIQVNDFEAAGDGRGNSVDKKRGEELCRQLEQGKILFFDHIPFEALASPDDSPARVLEKMCKKSLMTQIDLGGNANFSSLVSFAN